MKIILMIILIFFYATAQAGNDSHKLNVDMLNLGSENCTLTNSEILHGKVLEGSIPGYLPGTGMIFHFKIGLTSVSSHNAAYIDAELKLTYQCGSAKHFTIYMKQYYKKDHYHGQMAVNMTESVDVHETHEVAAPERAMDIHNNPHPGSVRWTFWN